MAPVTTTCFLVFVMIMILMLATLTKGRSLGHADVMQEPAFFETQFAPVEYFEDMMDESTAMDDKPAMDEDMPALDAEDGELMTGAMNLEAFEGGELHAFEAPP
jgi:hypothetical protein